MPQSNDNVARPADPLRYRWTAILTVTCRACRARRRGAVSLWSRHYRLDPDRVTLSTLHRRLICAHCGTRWPDFDCRYGVNVNDDDWHRDYHPPQRASVH